MLLKMLILFVGFASSNWKENPDAGNTNTSFKDVKVSGDPKIDDYI